MPVPLVLLPGMMCDARLFAPQAASLGDVAEVWVGDLTRAERVEDLAADVLGEAPFERFALGGLSMGGIVAMQVVLQAPHRVAALALLDTNHRAEAPERRSLREAQMERVRAGRLREVLVEEMKPQYLGPGAREDAALLDSLLAMGLDLGPEVFLRQSRALRDRPDAAEALGAVRVPSLVLCGRHDRLCPVERHREIADLLGTNPVVIEEAGHLPTLEASEAVNAALRRWLDAAAREIGRAQGANPLEA